MRGAVKAPAADGRLLLLPGRRRLACRPPLALGMVFLDGQWVSADEARVSAFDAAVQHGVGLFETMSARTDGKTVAIHRLGDHLRRLAESCRWLGLWESVNVAGLGQAIEETVRRSGHSRARVRVTITGGNLNLLGGRQTAAPRAGEPPRVPRWRPTVMVVAQPATEYPQEMFERGVGVVIASLRVDPLDPLAGHKTVNYWARLRELRAAAARHASEALVFQITNHLAGGCVSNVFVVRRGRLLTPPARGDEAESHGSTGDGAGDAAPRSTWPSPVLPGITRQATIDWARTQGVTVERRPLTIEDVLGAEEMFLTNSSFGILPVVRVEGETIGGGRVGELTRQARQAWEQAVWGGEA